MAAIDAQLLRLLRANARESVSSLARKLGVSRATVQDHMEQLERRRVIQGYTIRYHPDHQERQVCAQVMIRVDAKLAGPLVRHIEAIDEVEQLQTISGSYDLLATVSTQSTQSLDLVIDRLAALDGVEKTLSSVVLATKFKR